MLSLGASDVFGQLMVTTLSSVTVTGDRAMLPSVLDHILPGDRRADEQVQSIRTIGCFGNVNEWHITFHRGRGGCCIWTTGPG